LLGNYKESAKSLEDGENIHLLIFPRKRRLLERGLNLFKTIYHKVMQAVNINKRRGSVRIGERPF
jgi:hypothetical protein